jgi:predicted lipoprotein with Yx(FWY)xxD motif
MVSRRFVRATRPNERGTIMKRYALLAGVLIAAASYTALASASPRARKASGATVDVHETIYGTTILVDSSGFTLYEFSKDSKKRDRCVKISGCPSVWPPLEVSGAPTAGSGVNAALLSTITLSGGASQVLYAGHPLYTHPADAGPAETYYFGAKEFRGRWYGLSATGERLK